MTARPFQPRAESRPRVAARAAPALVRRGGISPTLKWLLGQGGWAGVAEGDSTSADPAPSAACPVREARLHCRIRECGLDGVLKNARSPRDQGLGREIPSGHDFGLRPRVPVRQGADRRDRQERLAVEADIARSA